MSTILTNQQCYALMQEWLGCDEPNFCDELKTATKCTQILGITSSDVLGGLSQEQFNLFFGQEKIINFYQKFGSIEYFKDAQDILLDKFSHELNIYQLTKLFNTFSQQQCILTGDALRWNGFLTQALQTYSIQSKPNNTGNKQILDLLFSYLAMGNNNKKTVFPQITQKNLTSILNIVIQIKLNLKEKHCFFYLFARNSGILKTLDSTNLNLICKKFDFDSAPASFYSYIRSSLVHYNFLEKRDSILCKSKGSWINEMFCEKNFPGKTHEESDLALAAWKNLLSSYPKIVLSNKILLSIKEKSSKLDKLEIASTKIEKKLLEKQILLGSDTEQNLNHKKNKI